jgi:t-SNARE complex subunit (syntaxin)
MRKTEDEKCKAVYKIIWPEMTDEEIPCLCSSKSSATIFSKNYATLLNGFRLENSQDSITVALR